MPSHNENFGNVVVESLSQGTPVIASTGTPWQILQKYKAGYWISNSPEKIAEILDDVLILSKQEYNLMRLNSENERAGLCHLALKKRQTTY